MLDMTVEHLIKTIWLRQTMTIQIKARLQQMNNNVIPTCKRKFHSLVLARSILLTCNKWMLVS